MKNAQNYFISIHSLRVEGDCKPSATLRKKSNFNPLPPCGGRPSCRLAFSCSFFNFNPLPPCGGRHGRNADDWLKYIISIHSLRVEGDDNTCYNNIVDRTFQSTPSVWRETSDFLLSIVFSVISIHSLRVEGDPFSVISNTV